MTDDNARTAVAGAREGNAGRVPILFGPRGHPWAGPRFGETMPFPGHRTVAEVWADEARELKMRGSGR